jgi:hypothetical protein
LAVLSNAERTALWAQLMRDLSDARETCGLTKPQLQAAVDAADSWADSNAASFNTALPVAARNNLTTGQKARLLAAVILRRWQVS